MRTSSSNLIVGVISSLALSVTSLRADQLLMQNGDRYLGTIVTVTADSVVLQSEVLGKVTLPRSKVSSLAFGNSAATNAAPISTPASSPASPNVTSPNVDIAAIFRSLGANTNFVGQVRDQMLAGAGPEANGKFDELVDGLMSGKLNLNDLRSQAKTSINQINQLKHDLGPDADDALDGYLSILEGFVNETESAPVVAPSGSVAVTNVNSMAIRSPNPAFRPGAPQLTENRIVSFRR